MLCSVRWLLCAVYMCVYAGVGWVPAKTASSGM
ncbi:hypothetical protein T08_15502 [Trichinella sp. T8]|nr:hypothetical protein T08_15502 [Trichinella sp. T8]